MPPSDQQKHTLNLRRGDYEKISIAYAPQGVKAATIIRHLVSKFVDVKLKKMEPGPGIDLDLEIDV